MTTVRVTLRRSPKSVTLGNHVVEVSLEESEEIHRDALPSDSLTGSQTAGAESALVPSEDGGTPGSSASELAVCAVNAARESGHVTPVATVLTDLTDRVVTPLSAAIPVLTTGGGLHQPQPVQAELPPMIQVDPARMDMLLQMLQQVTDEVTELQEQHRNSLNEMQEATIELAVAAASWLVGAAIDRQQFAVDDLVRRALDQMEISEPVRVRMNPDDHDLMKLLLQENGSDAELEQLTVMPDDSLARGTCRVESGRRVLITDMESRLEEIRRTWMENLDDSQIERRGDGSTGRTLRRFPDRREASQRTRADAS